MNQYINGKLSPVKIKPIKTSKLLNISNTLNQNKITSEANAIVTEKLLKANLIIWLILAL